MLFKQYYIIRFDYSQVKSKSNAANIIDEKKGIIGKKAFKALCLVTNITTMAKTTSLTSAWKNITSNCYCKLQLNDIWLELVIVFCPLNRHLTIHNQLATITDYNYTLKIHQMTEGLGSCKTQMVLTELCTSCMLCSDSHSVL